MRWVRDTTGRLAERPHLKSAEIDAQCEAVIAGFLRAKYGAVRFPVETNDLVVLLESVASDLDLYADLDAEGVDVEGVTEFVPGEQPRVRIARRLAEDSTRENRLRTTLAHELGHVTLHSFLWSGSTKGSAGGRGAARLAAPRPPLAGNAVGGLLVSAGAALERETASFRCRRGTVMGAPRADWLEWQAGYASGAFLVPAGALAKVAAPSPAAGDGRDARPGRDGPPWSDGGPSARRLIHQVQHTFQVSQSAATVRLLALGHVTPSRHAFAGLPYHRGRPRRAPRYAPLLGNR